MLESLLKPAGRYLARHPLFNPLVSPLFRGLVNAQVALVAIADRLLPVPAGDDPLLDELTLVIKTFERRPLLHRLLRSIRRRYPRIRIVVVDDSRHTRPVDGVEYVTLPFDSGVSAGRNAGLARVHTPYTMILDDDFVFYRRTDLLASLRRMMDEPAIDILGGVVIALPGVEWNDSGRSPIYKPGAQPPVGELGGLPLRWKVPNFFIARTARLAQVGWDDRLKRLDHIDFFTRADGVLRTVLNPSLRCLHVKSPFDLHYMSFRRDYQSDYELLRQLYPGAKVE